MFDMIRRIIILTLLCIILVIPSGCWDRIEIEENAFILGMGIDTDSESSLRVTYQIALPQAMAGGEQGDEGGDNSSTLVITVEGESFKVIEQKLISNIDRFPNYDHLKIIIFGEEFAKRGLNNYIDFLFRNPQARRLTKASVCEGDAKDLFDIQPKTAKSISQYLDVLLEFHNKHSIYIIARNDLTRLEHNFLRDTDFILPKLTIQEDTIEAHGAGIFKFGQLLGWVESPEIVAVKWISDNMHKGVIYLPELDDQSKITAEIINTKTKAIPVLDGGNISFDIDVDLEFDVAEVSKLDYIVLDDSAIFEIERRLANEIKSLCEETFYKMRDTYNADLYEFSNKIYNYYPLFWEEHDGVWGDYFKTSEIEVNVNAKMRRVGLVK